MCGDNLITTEIPKGKNAQLGSIRREVRETDKAWLAGIIDGEGYMIIVKHYNPKKQGRYSTVRIGVQNCDLRIVEKVSQIFYAVNASFYYQLRKHKNPNHSPSIEIIADGQGSCKKILDVIYDYLISKKDQAGILYEFISWRKESTFSDDVAVSYRDKLRDLRSSFPDPSQTTRRASQILRW